MLQTRSVNDKCVAVSWNPTEIFLREHGKEQRGKEQQLLFLDNDGVLSINQSVADHFGLQIIINK